MKGLWARLRGRVRGEEAEQADERARTSPAEREVVAEPAIERGLDEQIETWVDRDPDPDDPDGPDKLLTGLGS